MNIQVFSRRDIEKYVTHSHDNSALLISISSYDEFAAKVRHTTYNGIKDVLFLCFDDVDDEVWGIQPIDATLIRRFLEKNLARYNIDTILVNCGAGQSRSAGVAAALMVYFNGNDKPIFKNPLYKPNMLCYRTVLNEMFGEGIQ